MGGVEVAEESIDMQWMFKRFMQAVAEPVEHMPRGPSGKGTVARRDSWFNTVHERIRVA